jgi:hypothetical protein
MDNRRTSPLCGWFFLLACGAWPSVLHAQSSPELKLVMDRLDRLEAQNQELLQEVRSLRQQLASPQATLTQTPPAPTVPSTVEPAVPVAEQVEINERRIAEQDQSKVSTDHKYPLSITGMLLENTFWTGRGGGGADNPTLASATPGQSSGGATFRQTVIGLKYDGADIIGGGKVTGSVYFDLFGGTGGTLNQMMRLRVASLDSTWKDTTVTFALDKPLIAPMEPDSLAQVGVSPLTSAGNLWIWQPQLRVEHRFHFGERAGLRAQAGIWQTAEGNAGAVGYTPAKARPGYQSRFQLWKDLGKGARIEIAPGFHFSDTHVAGQSVPSRVFAMDWLIRPIDRIDFSGTFFSGENVAVLGGLRQGVVIVGDLAHAVHATGGMVQLKIRATPRMTFNLYGGQEDDRNSDLLPGSIGKNQTYAANMVYRFGSNVLTSIESSQTRTDYLGSGRRMFPHYDLAIAYMF